MNSIDRSTALYRIDECPDLMADACVCDATNQLIFGSFWGRDTAVQEFLAKLTLGAGNHGLDKFHLINDHVSLPVHVHKADRLKRHSTRVLQRTLFGSLLNTWLIDERCTEPDKANATAFAIVPRGSSDETLRLWTLIKETCPLPLLDHWQGVVIDVLKAEAMLTPLLFSVGPQIAFHLTIDVPLLTTRLSDHIRAGRLAAEPQTVVTEQLRVAA